MKRMRGSPDIRCVILGGGGHARVLIDCLLAQGGAIPRGVLDVDRALWGTELLGVPVLGGDDLLPRLAQEGVSHFVVGVGGVADNQPRRLLFELAVSHGLEPLTVCHPSAVCSSWATVGAGSVLYPTAVVNAGAFLGVNVIVNTGAIVEHDCRVGDHVHLATGARLCSTVRIGDGAHIGAGATVRQRLSIGAGAMIGAGAVVVNDVEPLTVVAGVPARVLERHELQEALRSTVERKTVR
jgi:sugar O-acyltransferase (sialic acid O-acetyltransferase NeuD family)